MTGQPAEPDCSSDPAAVIAATYARWEGYLGHVERDVFGTTDPPELVAAVDAFCRERLGSGVGGYEFYAASVCSVHGVRLTDGRRVVVKVHRAGADTAHLEAVHAVQRHLADAGFPAPRPLVAPAPLAGGVAVAETMLSRDGWADAHDPAVRRLVAAGLARQIERCRELIDLPGLKASGLVTRQLWSRPHDRRFDFVATAAGAEWIDRLAAEAWSRLGDEAAGDVVVGHNDWRVEHLRFAGGVLSAVWDWDSVSLGPEPAYVGSAAHTFPSDGTIDGLRCVPTLAEALAFIADYEEARGAPFSAAERRTATVSLVATMAYDARCEHSDARTAMGTRPPRSASNSVPADGFCGFLAAHGPGLLGIKGKRQPSLR